MERRSDRQVFRFTDHSTQIRFAGEDYEPSGGPETSATRMQDSLHAQNFEIEGAITSDKITVEDLRRGLWRDTEVKEFIIDWAYPAAGALKTSRYWITETEWDGEVWQASVEGGARWLEVTDGYLATRNCRWDLGGGFASGIGCRVNIALLTIRGVDVTTVTDARRVFTGGSQIPLADTRERYRFGRVIWVAGPNSGTSQEILDYDQLGTRVIELAEPTPADITSFDDFDLEPGCDKIRPTCITEYNKLEDFGGFPFMPGTNKLLLKPQAFIPPPPSGLNIPT